MRNKHLMFGLAALALALTMGSCSKENFGTTRVSDEQAFSNAELALGVSIDPAQDWNMTSGVTASVAVSLGLDQRYTVAVYDQNPLDNAAAVYYAKTEVADGQQANLSFVAPSVAKTFYVAVYDSHFRSVVQSATVVDGKLTAAFGAAGSHRAQVTDADAVPYARTAQDYLNPDLETARQLWRDNSSIAWKADKLTVETVSEADMKSYPALTDYVIVNETDNGSRDISAMSWKYNPADYVLHGDGRHYRIAKGTEVTEVFHIRGAENVINSAIVYVEGTVHLKSNTLCDATLVVASGGTVIVDSYTETTGAGRFVVLAGGTLTGTAGLNVTNGGMCYNAGTINLPTSTLNVNGSDFYNCGTVTVGTLTDTSKGGRITNFGHITGNNNLQAAEAYNCEVINGCYMHFKQDAGFGQLTMLTNSRLDVDGEANIEGGVYSGTGPELHHLSEINACSIFLNGTKFSGPTAQGEYAVIKAQKMRVNNGPDLTVTGNIYLDWCVNTGLYDHNNDRSYNCTVDNGYTFLSWIKQQNYNYSNEACSPLISIPAGECTGAGYNPQSDEGSGIVGSPAVTTYAFEDTKMGDYDMNDVVLKANESADGENIEIKLVAAGATLNLNIRLYDYDAANAQGNYYGSHYTTLKYNGSDEVHAMLNVDPGTMVNTGNGANARPVTITVAKGSYDAAKLRLAIYSEAEGEMRLAGSGQAPFGVVIPVDWSWPRERVNITRAYNESAAADEADADKDQRFATFAAEAGRAESWYKYPSGNVMNEATLGY